MRVIAGEYRGRRIVAPKGRGVRPTLDRVREAIADALAAHLPGARVLDLFAGSGAFGIEALSRGAVHATFCDLSARSCDAIRENLARLRIPASAARVMQAPARAAIERLGRESARFEVAFVDPPYEAMLYDETLLALSIAGLVSPGGIVVVEHSRRIALSPVYGTLHAGRVARYGDTCVTFYSRAEGARSRTEDP